jgi:hypothetical protein
VARRKQITTTPAILEERTRVAHWTVHETQMRAGAACNGSAKPGCWPASRRNGPKADSWRIGPEAAWPEKRRTRRNEAALDSQQFRICETGARAPPSRRPAQISDGFSEQPRGSIMKMIAVPKTVKHPAQAGSADFPGGTKPHLRPRYRCALRLVV